MLPLGLQPVIVSALLLSDSSVLIRAFGKELRNAKRGGDVTGVGVRHRLDDDRRASTDRDAPDDDRPRLAALLHAVPSR